MSQEQRENASTVVIGVGNELMRDDGAGVVVARALQGEGLPAWVRVVEGGVGGLDLLFELEGAARAVIVDAADMGLGAGEIRVFTPEEAEFETVARIASLHQIALPDVLELGRMTGMTAEVTIVGIQPAEVAPGTGLSPQVGQAVAAAMETVKALLAQQ